MALVQLNDPDPIHWVALYGLCALVPLLNIFHVRNRVFNYVCIGFCLIILGLNTHGVLEYFHHISEESLIQDMSDAKPYIEEAREFFGTVIALVIVTGYQVMAYRLAK